MAISDQGNSSQSQVQQAREHLQKTYSLREEQISKLIRITVSGLKENIDMAQKVMADADHSELGLISHSMKGSLLTLGMVEYAEMARVIEHHAANNDEIAYDDLILELRTSIDELLEYNA